jgi:hypothetical protein
MKNAPLTAVTVLFMVLGAPHLCGAQTKRSHGETDQTHKATLTKEMSALLTAQMVKEAYNPEWFEKCVDEAGGIEKTIDIQSVSLGDSKATQYLLVGNPPCAFGARTSTYWIYEYRDGKIRSLADLGAEDDVKIGSRRTNGYRDVEVVSITRSGAEECTGLYKFDGKRYQEAKGSSRCKRR